MTDNEALPNMFRTLPALKTTERHLLNYLDSKDPRLGLGKVAMYVWDRQRSIRQDMAWQKMEVSQHHDDIWCYIPLTLHCSECLSVKSLQLESTLVAVAAVTNMVDTCLTVSDLHAWHADTMLILNYPVTCQQHVDFVVLS